MPIKIRYNLSGMHNYLESINNYIYEHGHDLNFLFMVGCNDLLIENRLAVAHNIDDYIQEER